MTMRYLWFFLLAAPFKARVDARLNRTDQNLKCGLINVDYWQTLAAHFSYSQVITINILHWEDHDKRMIDFINFILKQSGALKKPVCVMHTYLSNKQNVDAVTRKSASLVLAWDERILENYLDAMPRYVIKDRSRFAILFLSCSSFGEGSAKVLKRFWKDFHVLDIHFTGCCYEGKIYQYDPLLQQMKVLKASEVSE